MPCAAIIATALATSCGEPARVGGRTLDEHLARIDEVDAPLRPPLVRELGEFGEAADAAVPRLAGWLRDDPRLRDEAAQALAEIGTASAQRTLLAVLALPVLLVLIGSSAPLPAQVVPPAGADSVTVVPGAAYRAGGFYSSLAGGGHRELWTTPITVPVADPAILASSSIPLNRTAALTRPNPLVTCRFDPPPPLPPHPATNRTELINSSIKEKYFLMGTPAPKVF